MAKVQKAKEAEYVSGSNVTVNLSVENDPQQIPTVDGNSQPKVDINIPL